jgi:hypothetical protein
VRRFIGTASVCVILAVPACSSDGNGDSEGPPFRQEVVPVEPEASSTTAAATTTTTTEQSPADIAGSVVVRGPDSSCTNPAPSSPGLAATATHVGVAGYAGNAARVTWTYTGTLPKTGTVLFSLIAASADGQTTQQLGFKTMGGRQIAYFTADKFGWQQNVSGYPDVSTPGEVAAVMPSAAVASLGPEWHWYAVLNIDGKDLDRCPPAA